MRAKERYYRTPSSGGWRDLMLNLQIQIRSGKGEVVVHTGELQIVHETMLSARYVCTANAGIQEAPG